MLLVKHSLKEIKGKGIGVISEEHIKKGQSIWTFNPIVDIIIQEEDIPKEAEDFFEKYGVEAKEKPRELMLNTDNTRFINHSSKNPNLKSTGFRKDIIATKEIKPGEELKVNYHELDMNPLGFEEVE